jgi:diaminopropionate ammonia-lyase
MVSSVQSFSLLERPDAPAPDPRVEAFHRGLPDYRPTPLRSAPRLAQRLGIHEVWIKDETERLGLSAFKALGASWAIHRALEERAPSQGLPTFVCATEGNHGRAVARFSRVFGASTTIFVSSAMPEERVRRLRDEGAEVIAVEGNYDRAVEAMVRKSREDPTVIALSDTSDDPTHPVPGWVCEGYSTMFVEMTRQLPFPPSVVFVPAGVGSLLSAATRHFGTLSGAPAVVAVEPSGAACVRAALEADRPLPLSSVAPSMMNGLNCGVVSAVAWQEFRGAVAGSVLVSDADAKDAMELLAAEGVQAGAAGAASVAGALVAIRQPSRPAWLQPSARAVFLVTEGARM